MFTPRVGGPRGHATVGSGGGGFELGVAAVNRNAWLLIPYLGAGGGGVTLDVTNTSNTTLTIGDDEPLPAEGRRSYSAGFAYVELGLAAHRLLFRGPGGFAVGVDAGALVSVVSSPWNNDAGGVDGISRPRITGGFLRLTLGGGGFRFD